MNLQPMTPFAAGTVSLAATDTTGNVALTANASTVDRNVIVTSLSDNGVAFIEFGTASTVAAVAATSTPILPGSVQTFSVGEATYVAAICGSGDTATLYFTSGHGA